jgi:pilus assembly protein Flp/PilA
MKLLLTRFCADETGATAIEYALLVTLMSVALIASMVTIKDSLNGFFEDTASAFEAPES